MAAGLAGSWSGPIRFGLRTARLAARHAGPLWALLVVLGLVGQVPLFTFGGRSGKLLVLFSLALSVFYPLSGVPWFPWYTLPMAVAILYGIGFSGGAAVRLLARGATPARRAAGLLAGALLAVSVLASLLPACYAWHRRFHWPEYMERYRAAGLWLAAHSPPGASVAYYEVGALGYFSERTVVDLLGIVTPELVPYVRRGDFAGAFLARPADYAIFDAVRGGLMPVSTSWFRAAYRPVAGFGELTVFARQPGVALPASPPRLGLPGVAPPGS
jgi:hypothetical protein